MRSFTLFPVLACLLLAANGCQKNKNCPDPELLEEHKDDMCITIYAPVCGCDGQTYGNECEARRNGIRVVRVGEC